MIPWRFPQFKRQKLAFLVLTLSLLAGVSLPAQKTAIPFMTGEKFESTIQSPSDYLGFPLGSRAVRYSEAAAYLRYLSEHSPRVKLEVIGKTYEGRAQLNAVISSAAHIRHLEQIRSAIAELATGKSGGKTDIIKSSPAVAMMMYAVHGDELSSTDAALRLAYQLVAGADSVSQSIRQNLVVVIDPMENPDGRERYLSQMQQWWGNVPNSDVQSVQHTGIWPRGRTNHYLFDLNRDWFILSQPETRARVNSFRKWNPQIAVDSHEMSWFSTYFFPPSREPVHPGVRPEIRKWWKLLSKDQARAFDRHGWPYYTDEEFDDWYPGYGTSWPYFNSAVGILYEQARTDGSLVKRPDGSELRFRDAVRHHFVSSMANLQTAAKRRQELLSDFARMKAAALKPIPANATKVYYISAERYPDRVRRLANILREQGIRFSVASKEFTATGLKNYWNESFPRKQLPAGTLIIPLRQPLRPLVDAIMNFDQKLSRKFLQEERASLLKDKTTKMYEVSGWSLPEAFDLAAYKSSKLPGKSAATEPKIAALQVRNAPAGAFGWLFDASDDNGATLLAWLLDLDFTVHCAKKPFRAAGRDFPPGSCLISAPESAEQSEALRQKADSLRVELLPVNSALTPGGPDLGGPSFVLLRQPRTAVLAGPGIRPTSFSSVWFLLDRKLELRHSILRVETMGDADLRKYNVIVLPGAGSPKSLSKIFDKDGLKKIKAWMESGGTLIAMGNSAVFLADTSRKISKVRLRRQALGELSRYAEALNWKKKELQRPVSESAVWNGAGQSAAKTSAAKAASKPDVKVLALRDERVRVFQPRGAILRTNLNPNHWMAYGLGDKIPAILYSSYAFLAMDPVEVPARFAAGRNLRISGLLWPEARRRWGNTAYTTREKVGRGQLILFADDPFFRAYFYGSGRLLINAILLGPAFGAKEGVGW